MILTPHSDRTTVTAVIVLAVLQHNPYMDHFMGQKMCPLFAALTKKNFDFGGISLLADIAHNLVNVTKQTLIWLAVAAVDCLWVGKRIRNIGPSVRFMVSSLRCGTTMTVIFRGVSTKQQCVR